jgi:hypothetical protein
VIRGLSSRFISSGVQHLFQHSVFRLIRRRTMYEMYPEWGPAKHNPESPMNAQAVQAALDLRDNGGERPDDN